MSILSVSRSVLFLSAITLSFSCGQQLVEYPLPGEEGCPLAGDAGVCPSCPDGQVEDAAKGSVKVVAKFDLSSHPCVQPMSKVDSGVGSDMKSVAKFDMSFRPRDQPMSMVDSGVRLDIKSDVKVVAKFDMSFRPRDLTVSKVDAAVDAAVVQPDLFPDSKFAPDLPLVPDSTVVQPDAAMIPDAAPVDPCALLPVELGAAESYAVLGGSTVTSTGPSMITGDLGLSPGSAVVGFPPGVLVGALHVGDPVAAAAQLDLTTAFNDAAGRTLCSITVAGNLGGQTLAPGLYHSESSLEISSGDLTLDAQGDPDAVWIFQMASTLTTTPGRAVILAGGAQAKNVFWVVGSSATLGTTSVMYGTIMAYASITLETGAVLNGRALARIGAVSLDSSAVTVPSP